MAYEFLIFIESINYFIIYCNLYNFNRKINYFIIFINKINIIDGKLII